jgi:hypothetical protein
MRSSRKSRTATTSFEQKVFGNYIHRFFAAGERSVERGQIVKAVIEELGPCARKWTDRSVRLWFNNNRKRCVLKNIEAVRHYAPPPVITYLDPNLPMMSLTPGHVAYGYIPIHVHPMADNFSLLVLPSESGMAFRIPELHEQIGPPMPQQSASIQFSPLIYCEGV